MQIFLYLKISPTPEITTFAIPLLRTISIFVVFDFLQLILAGALRGAETLKRVMWGRFITRMFFFFTNFVYPFLHRHSVALVSNLDSFMVRSTSTQPLWGLFFLVYLLRGNWYNKNL